MLDADNFLNMLKNPTMSIDKIIDTEKSKQVLKNRKNIIPIIEVIILCGCQNLTLKGHRDSRKLKQILQIMKVTSEKFYITVPKVILKCKRI